MRSLLLLLLLLLPITSVAPASAQPPSIRIAGVTQRDGGAEVALVHRALRAGLARLRYCQERRISQGGGIHGRLTIALTVTPDDPSSGVEVTDRASETDPAVEACVLHAMSGLRYPVTGPAVFDVELALSAPDSRASAPPTDEAPALRAEIAAARSHARCLLRAAARLEHLLAAWERAGPARRERLTTQIAEARAASAMCGASLLGSLGGGTGTGIGLTPGCVACRDGQLSP